ncbi:MAG: phosphotransferase [Gammaproteobacteria bacterium]|nr:phosphotransferase [Gammaproteobacteria bacterium]
MAQRPVAPTPPIPEDGRSLDLDWVRRALAAGGRLALPTGIRIEEVGVGSGVMGQVMRCHLDYGESNDSAPASIIVKLPSVNAKTRRLGKRLLLYRREYDFYRTLASRIPVSTPRLLYGDFEPKSHRFALVLEDIRGMAVVDQIAGASPAQAKRAIRALARMHGAYWNRTREAPVSGSYDSNNPKLSPIVQVVYLANLVRTLKHFGDAFSSTTRPLAEAFGLGVVDHMAALGAGPRTFTHGDYRLDNLFFGDGGDDGVTVIDWQVSGLSCGLYDVGYFLAGNLTAPVRRQIERDAVEEYHDIVCRSGAVDFTFDECWRMYRQNTLAALLTSVIVCGGLDLDDDRSRRLAEVGLKRSLAAIEDLDVAEFIPDRSRPSRNRRLFTHACRIAYGAYRSYKGI